MLSAAAAKNKIDDEANSKIKKSLELPSGWVIAEGDPSRLEPKESVEKVIYERKLTHESAAGAGKKKEEDVLTHIVLTRVRESYYDHSLPGSPRVFTGETPITLFLYFRNNAETDEARRLYYHEALSTKFERALHCFHLFSEGALPVTLVGFGADDL